MSASLPSPLGETERLSALYRYEILDSPPEKELDDLVHLAAYICHTPIAVISLVDSKRQWFKSKIGLTATEASRYIAFCAHTILGLDLLIVPDALSDERFVNNPLVTGEPHIRFYCGAPLITPERFCIGTLSAIDHVPRELSTEQLEAVLVLSRQVMDHLTLDRERLELIQVLKERQRVEQVLQSSESKFRKLSETTSSGIYIYSRDRFLYANPAAAMITGYHLDELRAMSLWQLIHPAFHNQLKTRVQAVQQGDSAPARFQLQIVRKDGEARWLDFTDASMEFDGQQARIGTAYDITECKRVEETLRQRERDLRAALEERERISRDLHDGILQSLFAVGLGLETTKLIMSSRNRKTSGASLNQAIDQLNRVMHEIRNFIVGLGSDLLQGKDLPTALKHMLGALTENQATRVRLAVEDRAAQAVSSEQSLHLFLVIQEAVSNCIRHGRAREARVSLKMLKQGVRLSIRDDGRGFNPNAVKGTGHGLSNMAARAQKLGGRFTILSKVHEGTRVVLDLPKEASSVRR